MLNPKLHVMEVEKTDELEQQETVETTEEEQVGETGKNSEEQQEQVEQEQTEEETQEETEDGTREAEEEASEESEEKTEEAEKETEEEKKEVDISTETLVAKAKEINPEAGEENYLPILVGQLDKLSEYYTRSQEANSKLIEAFEVNPTVADILKDVISGADLRIAIARHFSPEDLTPVEGDPDYEAWNKSAEERKNNLKTANEQKGKLAENTEKSKEAIKVFAEKNKLSEQEMNQFLGNLDKSLDDLYNGIVSEDFLKRMLHAFNYNKDVKKAKEVGEIVGRNAKIETKKKSGDKTGDDMPHVEKKASIEEKPRRISSLDEIIEREKSKTML